MQVAGLVIFAITYVLIAARRMTWIGLDRPAGALVGAVACVVTGALTPATALAAIDGSTLLLLFGVMGMGAFLAVDGFFDELETGAVRFATTPAQLLGLIVWSGGILSAFITNDAVCILGAPVVIRLVTRFRLPPLPFLLALATAANTGSAATLVGNPQNMLCGLLGTLSYRDHLALVGPVALVGLAINHGVLWLLFRRVLGSGTLAPVGPAVAFRRRTIVTLAVIAGTAIAYARGTHMAWTAVAGFVALMLLHRRDTRQLWTHIDWALLLFFAGLFVVVEGLMQSGAPASFFEMFPLAAGGDGLGGWVRLSGIFLLGSNLVTNVPFILVVRDQLSTLPDPRLGWELLAMASTFAGNLTLLGSVANIIVAEAARDVGGIGFFEYLRVGLPIALLTTLVGVLGVVLLGT